jgi:hypothetical protein
VGGGNGDGHLRGKAKLKVYVVAGRRWIVGSWVGLRVDGWVRFFKSESNKRKDAIDRPGLFDSLQTPQ